ncbi:MAG: hypothetical protein ACM3OG_05070 [Actinomycetota bacterium]
MRTLPVPVRHVARAALCALLLVSFVLAPPVPASAAGYSRRIAIAPFSSLTKEDIGATVSVLPRLLASRLMALAGADVVLLPAGGKAAEAAAKEAKVPLLLQGTVSKLGKGYSIDATVTDLDTGKPAGAFFAAASTEDDIIAQLGVLSGEISEKLFGVQGAIRATAPAAPVVAPAPASAGIPSIGGAPAASAPFMAPPPPPAPVPTTPAQGWTPTSLVKVGQSDKIPDELYGVTMVESLADGEAEVVAWGLRVLYFYRVKGTEVLPFSRITKETKYHFLNVEAVDVDGDGRKELLATVLAGDRFRSIVYKKGGETYSEAAWDLPYYLTVVTDALGKRVVVGQRQGFERPFRGNLYRMNWVGKTLKEGEAFAANTDIKPLNQGILGLSAGKSKEGWRWFYTDEDSHLRVLEPGGKTIFLSKEKHGTGIDLFEWGALDRTDQKRPQYFLRKAPRISEGSGGMPLLLTSEVDKGTLNLARFWEKSRLVILQWEDGSFSEKAGTKMEGIYFSEADFLSTPLHKGGRIIASVIEQEGSVSKDKISRLILYRAE